MNLKFKAWDGVKMRSVYKVVFDLLTDELCEVVFFREVGYNLTQMYASDPRLKLLQWTGKTTHTGTEIYDGDILKTRLNGDEPYYVVRWSDESSQWAVLSHDESGNESDEYALFQLDAIDTGIVCDVVGNTAFTTVLEIIEKG